MGCAFWKSLDILIKKPHVVNKRLWGSKTILKTVFSAPDIWEPLHMVPTRLNTSGITEDDAKDYIKQLNIGYTIQNSVTVEVILVELLPKNFDEPHAFQLILLRKDKVTATFYDITPEVIKQKLCPNFPYSIETADRQIVLRTNHDVIPNSLQWLKETVIPQVQKWSDEFAMETSDGKDVICKESLVLVSFGKYYNKYNELKKKYGKEMVKIWPECTDPSKFVYEDVAIATYLLLLWEDEREKLGISRLQTFVDLGCGNGLLVYILAMEGHPGVGIDVRKRQIWDIYPSNVHLEERTIIPSDLNLFPESDWIIGNHSDELTPWIPVVAARSSYKCNFFLLPCCAYNFDGTKYQRHDSSKSQYTEYLEYIKYLCEECGFHTSTDRLKIPSTKRICLIGRGRSYGELDYELYNNKIQNMINMPVNPDNNDDKRLWIDNFKPRDPVEKVRNCTQIDKALISTIVEAVAKYLLEDCDAMSPEWFPGKLVEINEIVSLISKQNLKALKAECGGLQTLLKNNHHIFKVQSGKVQLRYPRTVEQVNKDMKNKAPAIVQKKPCWFHINHPQGCPLTDASCSFLHRR